MVSTCSFDRLQLRRGCFVLVVVSSGLLLDFRVYEQNKTCTCKVRVLIVSHGIECKSDGKARRYLWSSVMVDGFLRSICVDHCYTSYIEYCVG